MDTKRLVIGCLAAAGMTLALGAASPALADDDWDNGGYWKPRHGSNGGNWNNGNNWNHGGNWNNGHGHGHNKHWKKHHNNGGYYQGGYYYAPPPVYYAPPPVYYAPPPVVYYPQPHYRRPSVSIVFPFNFD